MSETAPIQAICARLGEHYTDYLVIARTKDGKIAFRPSDMTWAIGACQRFLNYACDAQEVTGADDGSEENR